VADDENRRRDRGDPHDPDGRERNETATERADRNWNELLQELRVTQTGIQILTGFLLTVPFQQRFAELAPSLRIVFLVVSAADRLTKAGLATLAVTIVAVVVLVFGFVAGTAAAVVGGVLAGAFFLVQWVVVPSRLLGRLEERAGR